VRNILEGSVRCSGSRIRVTAQLIHAADVSQLWSERYDREMTDVFAVQDETGQAISEALKVRLAPRTPWQHYLRGRFHYFRYSPDGMAKAKECFEQALAIDPNYAPAYSGLAGFYYTLGVFGLKPARQVAPLAISLAEKALAVDPANSEAHSVMGVMAGCFDYDWAAAGAHYRRAICCPWDDSRKLWSRVAWLSKAILFL
jgi:serine/threonine-protein kinase